MTYEFLNDLYKLFLKKQTLKILEFSEDENLDIQLSFLWDEFVYQAHDAYELRLGHTGLWEQHLDLEKYLYELVPVFFEDTWWYDNNPTDQFRDKSDYIPLISLDNLGI